MVRTQFEKIKTKKKTAAIAEHLIDLINGRSLRKGMRLPSERDLSEQLGVSRGILREALSALEMAGVIHTKVGDGTYINLDGPLEYNYEASSILEKEENPLDILAVRKRIEPLSVRLAAENATSENIGRLESVVEEHMKALKGNEINYEIDSMFHTEIAELSGNKTLAEVMRLIASRMITDKFWRFAKERNIHEFNERNYMTDEHVQILEAIKSNDPDLAERLIIKHLDDVEQGLQRFF